MSKKSDKLKGDLHSVCHSIITEFCKKQELDFDGWVGGEVNGIASFSDQYFFTLNDIMLDLTKNQPKGFILEWQNDDVDFNLGLDNGKHKHLNYISYIMGARYDMLGKDLKESINHPTHYGGECNDFEPIKIIEHYRLNFCLGNAIKYILRAGLKGNKNEDLEKAVWYLKREIK